MKKQMGVIKEKQAALPPCCYHVHDVRPETGKSAN
jgi:hypothetical protein